MQMANRDAYFPTVDVPNQRVLGKGKTKRGKGREVFMEYAGIYKLVLCSVAAITLAARASSDV